MVVYLSRVWDSIQAFAHSGQRSGDEVSGALMAHAKHHGGPHIKGVALPVIVPCAPSRYDVPVATDKFSGMASLPGTCRSWPAFPASMTRCRYMQLVHGRGSYGALRNP